MGMADDEFGVLPVDIDSGRLTVSELEKLTSGEGLDVYFDELTVLDDGTLAYKDSRVLLYIRDVHVYGNHQNREPRYHVSHCRTLQEMTAKGRFERYVVSTEINGEFKLNFISKGTKKSERRRLSVCQNCLGNLTFDGFKFEMKRGERREIVRRFTPERFFKKYTRSLHGPLPRHNSENAPLDDYPRDWSSISTQTKRTASWRCEECKRDLSAKHLQRFLDVHHRNGVRRDSFRSNLKVVCVGCHAEEPNHAHVRNDPRYKDYLRVRPAAADVN